MNSENPNVPRKWTVLLEKNKGPFLYGQLWKFGIMDLIEENKIVNWHIRIDIFF